MNLKLVLRTYAAYRQMSPDDVALLETLLALSDSDRELLVESLGPQKPAGRSSKRSTSKSTKSRRASGLESTIKGNLQRREPTVGGFADDVDAAFCAHPNCGEGLTNPIHTDSTYLNHHPFQPPASTAAQGSTPASSGIDGGDVSNAVHAGG